MAQRGRAPLNLVVRHLMTDAPRLHWLDPRTWLAFMFWELRTIAAVVSGEDLADWKAVGVIVVFEILAVVGLTNAAAVYLGRQLIHRGSPYIFLVAFAVAAVNAPAILGKHDRWNRCSREFERYPKFFRIAGGIVVILLVAGSIIAAAHFGEAQRYLAP
jgi:hypothetical protein